MNFANSLKRTASAMLAVGAVASGALLASAATASADTATALGAGTLSVCSDGSYATQVEFPGRGGFSTFVVPSGQCKNTSGLSNNGIEPITVVGITDGGQKFQAGKGSFNASKGGIVKSYGVPGNAWAMTPQV